MNEQQREDLCFGWFQETRWTARVGSLTANAERILVPRCLQRWKYSPNEQSDVVELVLQQAQTLSAAWSLHSNQ